MASGDDEVRSYFYCAECPLSKQCTPGAWGKAKVWGATEEACRDKLHSHLVKSGNHTIKANRDVDMRAVANGAKLYWYSEDCRAKQVGVYD